MLVIVVVLFLVCWLPFHIMTLYQNFKPQSPRGMLFFQVMMFSLWLMCSNSSCNPIVYAVFNRNYRREFGRLLRWAFLQLFFWPKWFWASLLFSSIFIINSYILSGSDSFSRLKFDLRLRPSFTCANANYSNATNNIIQGAHICAQNVKQYSRNIWLEQTLELKQ